MQNIHLLQEQLYMYKFVCVYACKCMYACLCVCECMHACVCMCVNLRKWVCACLSLSLCLSFLFGKCLVWFLASRVIMQGCPWLFREPIDASIHHVSTYFLLSSSSPSFTQEVIYFYGKTVSHALLTIFLSILLLHSHWLSLKTRCATEDGTHTGVVSICRLCFILLNFCDHIVLHIKGFIVLIHD
jgi:hypothetical protein